MVDAKSIMVNLQAMTSLPSLQISPRALSLVEKAAIPFPPKPPITDWELTKPFVNPAKPKAGNSVYFGAILRALSTNRPFPQTVGIEVLGPSIVGSIGVTYAGPVGSAMNIKTTGTWKLKAGKYKVFLIADSPPPYHYNDPNRTNNQATISFTVT